MNRMNWIALALLVILIAMAVGTRLVFRQGKAVQLPRREAAAAVPLPPAHVPPKREAPEHAATQMGVASFARKWSAGDIQQMIWNTKDYFVLAKSILPRAKADDAAAQYLLWELHFFCYETGANASVQDYRGHALSLDEAIQKAASMNWPIEVIKQQWEQCHGFFSEDTSDLGDAMEWLQRATDAGYPSAQAETARMRLVQDQLKAFQKDGAVPTDYGLLPPIGGEDANPRELLRSAVTSLDPAVIAKVAEILPALDPSAPQEERRLNRAAWIYVACLRGAADCRGYGQPDMSYCAPTDSNCIGVPQQLLDWTNYNWDALRNRANEINAALDARQWDKLGF